MKHRGAISELIAASWLLQQGYEVFRNVSQHGPYDLVAIGGGETLLIDVTTSYTYAKTGSVTYPPKKGNARVLCVDATTGTCIWADLLPKPAKRS